MHNAFEASESEDGFVFMVIMVLRTIKMIQYHQKKDQIILFVQHTTTSHIVR